MRLSTAVEAFLTDCRARRLAVRTTDFYAWQLGQALTWLAGQEVTALADFTADHFRRYLVSLQDRNLAAASQHAAARALRAFLNFCEREDLLTGANPARKVKMPQLDKHTLPAVALADVRKLLDACEDSYDPLRDVAIIRLLTDTGLRAAELCALTVGDVTGKRVQVRHGKGDKARVVFIGDATRRALDAYLSTRPGVGPGDALIVSLETGGALTYIGLRQILARLGKRAGVAVKAHALRRTFAVESLRAGADLIRLARLMGHTDLTQLQKHYLPLLEDDLAATHDRTGPGDRLD
jgi:site-specific recombinase XerD